MKFYLERSLFVVGPQRSGKSPLLRSMFIDHRLDDEGKIPKASRIYDSYYLSHERHIHIRLTSPHERGEKPEEFMKKIEDKMGGGRWCFAGALQPDAYNKMPDVVESVRLFTDRFKPERARVAFLLPDWSDDKLETYLHKYRALSHKLITTLDRVEIIFVDARENNNNNGLLLADFFDFS